MSPVTARRGGLWGFAHPRGSSPPTWPGGLLLLSSLPREGRQVSGCAGGFVLRREQRQDRSGSARLRRDPGAAPIIHSVTRVWAPRATRGGPAHIPPA